MKDKAASDRGTVQLANVDESFNVIKVNLKTDINTFLWSRLPGSTTISRADEIACTIYNVIIAELESKNEV